MRLSSSLSWADKLALLSKFELSDTEACQAFGVPQRELEAARSLQARGTFQVNTSLNTEIYADFITKMRSGELDTSAKVFKPRTSSRPSKISAAFEAITATPQPVKTIMESFDVSLAVLRQSKRFDKVVGSQIHIRKDKDTQELMVWREPKDA